MSKDLISKKTRQEFSEWLVANSTLRGIEMEFDAADIDCCTEYTPHTSGQRRTLIAQYYHSIDWTKWTDIQKVLYAYENILNSTEEEVIAHLTKWLKKDGFIYQGERVLPIARMQILEEVKSVAVKFDSEHLSQQIKRIEDSIDADPALAIGSAKELVETCCKIILEECGQSEPKNANLPTLVKATLKVLKLLPDEIPDTSKGSQTIKRILSNLSTVANGVAELRNLYGTGHGKKGQTKGLQPRHAKLAVGAATTLTLFLFATFHEQEGGNRGGHG